MHAYLAQAREIERAEGLAGMIAVQFLRLQAG
jgi:hypothetical protein